MRPTTTSPRTVLAAVAALATTLTLAVSAPAATADNAEQPNHPGGGHCARQAKIKVPGAERQKVSCLPDLTTVGTVPSGHSVAADFAGLHAPGTVNPTGSARHTDRRLLPGYLDVQHQ